MPQENRGGGLEWGEGKRRRIPGAPRPPGAGVGGVVGVLASPGGTCDYSLPASVSSPVPMFQRTQRSLGRLGAAQSHRDLSFALCGCHAGLPSLSVAPRYPLSPSSAPPIVQTPNTCP